MADVEHTNLPHGVSIRRDHPWLIEYTGTEQALIAAGLLKPEAIEGLGRFTRQFTLSPNGSLSIIGEGKGNRISYRHRDLGAYAVKRLFDGNISLSKYRTRLDEMAINHANRERLKKEAQQETWQLAKQAHSQPDFPERWKNGVLHFVEQAENVIDGKAVFTDFPDIGLKPGDIQAAKQAIATLRNVLQSATPAIKDKIQQSNIVSLREAAFRYMKRG
ncbi:hypothetical protein [Dechloromonas denitrificans]|uniref:hypothetical protein n=1 Tax=Dechloromonas denitrificans TaxID=281362 RepID=UPI001CFBABE8|nr:hypothetical protein [Dechloromonas denitrificans]UCV09147.1 hypothetical protein KI615_06360 [Dechloromonas denitrificans]